MSSVNTTRRPESTSPGWSPVRDRQAIVLLALSLAVLTIALYLPALRNGFINFDDPDYGTRNAHVLRGLSSENLQWVFGSNNPAVPCGSRNYL